MKVLNKLQLKGETVFFGPGVVELMREIESTNSIKKASENMNLSYVKALRMVHQVNDELGFSAIVSHKGGSNYGGTQITSQGKEFLNAFERVEKRVEDFAKQEIEAHVLSLVEELKTNLDS